MSERERERYIYRERDPVSLCLAQHSFLLPSARSETKSTWTAGTQGRDPLFTQSSVSALVPDPGRMSLSLVL